MYKHFFQSETNEYLVILTSFYKCKISTGKSICKIINYQLWECTCGANRYQLGIVNVFRYV